MITYDDAIRYMPIVMRRLRLRAGHKTQTSALRAIRRNTGAGITGARICEWESGRTAPSLRSLFAFLLGLGYDFKDFQAEVEQLVGSDAPPTLPPVDPKQRERQRQAEAEKLRQDYAKLKRRHGLGTEPKT